MQYFVLALVMLVSLNVLAAEDPRGPGEEEQDFGVIEVPGLRCVIGNNKSTGEHRGGYNGIIAMTTPDQEVSPFVPFYAGINLEHYFGGGPRPKEGEVLFEPRFAPMEYRRINGATAELYQPPTPLHKTESWTRFEVKDPNYVDISFRCIPRERVYEGDFLGVFWASYMNAPINKSIYFLGPDATLDNPKWLQFHTQTHNHASTVLHQDDNFDAPYADNGLLYSNISPLRYSQPFYYGRIRNMVLIYIFKPNPYLRFCQSPSGGGRTPDGTDTNPAWDFELVVPEYKVDQEYGFTMRVVYKPWAGRDDVLKEVKAYLAE